MDNIDRPYGPDDAFFELEPMVRRRFMKLNMDDRETLSIFIDELIEALITGDTKDMESAEFMDAIEIAEDAEIEEIKEPK